MEHMHFPLFLTFLLIFMNTQIMHIFDYGMKGMCLYFKLVPIFVVYIKKGNIFTKVNRLSSESFFCISK